MRYFIELAYNGTAYYGWQRQPNQVSVQATLEQTLGMMLRIPHLEITGCGRTDTGVHASSYYAHFDTDAPLPDHLVSRINKVLPKDIAIRRVFPVAEELHARFDAHYRAYTYYVAAQKDPFRPNTVLHIPYLSRLDTDAVQATAQMLLQYDQFAPFCKTGSDAKTMHCQLHRSEWVFADAEWQYHIAANRFLRGMVRLIVGACLSVGEGKVALSAVRHALDTQTLLPKSLSIAPNGLFLTEVRYDMGEK